MSKKSKKAKTPKKKSNRWLVTFERFYEDDPWVEARGLFPLEGIPEDPATGSAAGPLAAHLALAGLLAPGETRVVLQGRHVGRPSRLAVSVVGERPRFTDVLVGGGVSLVIEGELRI